MEIEKRRESKSKNHIVQIRLFHPTKNTMTKKIDNFHSQTYYTLKFVQKSIETSARKRTWNKGKKQRKFNFHKTERIARQKRKKNNAIKPVISSNKPM